ncbi:MAG: hypothetical protein JWN26_24 [Candidatus Saccharibacteria bacterium]|nr:hypothetical protein [Candidatus Saccharibacteria bacterium]
MVKKQQIDPLPPTSQLERFVLGFEYDKTLQEVRREVRVRTDKGA